MKCCITILLNFSLVAAACSCPACVCWLTAARAQPSTRVPVTLGPFPHLQCSAVAVGIAVDPFHAQHRFNSMFIVGFPKTQAEIAHRV